MKGVVYLRVSTNGQVDGYGLASQERAARDYARANGIEVVRVFSDEGVSGSVPLAQRPGLLDALTYLQDSGADGLIVARLDRLARTLTVQEAILVEVWKHHRDVHTADGVVLRDDPDDPFRTAVRQIMGAFGQLDRALTVKRLRDGRKAKAAAGGHAVGPAPYGWRATNGDLHEVPAEQAALDRMFELRNSGANTRDIASTLAAEGHPTKRGGAWSSPVVSRILSRHPNTAATASA